MIKVDAKVAVEDIAKFQRAYKEGLREGLATAGDMIVNLASQLAPKDTGELSLSGRSVVIGDVLIVSFGNDLDDIRAFAQEYGTIFMEPQPYLHPAIKEIDIVEEVAKAIRARLL